MIKMNSFLNLVGIDSFRGPYCSLNCLLLGCHIAKGLECQAKGFGLYSVCRGSPEGLLAGP